MAAPNPNQSLRSLRVHPLNPTYAHCLKRKARLYLENGSLDLDNNTAERAVKPVVIGLKNTMCAGSACAGDAMAIAFTLVEAAKRNVVDPQV